MPATIPESVPRATRPALAPQARIEELEYELTLSREMLRRTEEERRRLDAHLAAAEAERANLRTALAQREAYVAAIHNSAVWKAAQALRRLLGRAW